MDFTRCEGEKMGSYREIKHLRVLRPTLREKKRYILIEFIPIDKKLKVKKEIVIKEILATIQKTFGTIGSGYFSLSLVKSKKTGQNQIIVRVNHLSVPFVIASLLFMKKIYSYGVVIKTLRVSGTIKSLLAGFTDK